METERDVSSFRNVQMNPAEKHEVITPPNADVELQQEKPESNIEDSRDEQIEADPDSDLVTWTGVNDPADPKNWKTGAKWTVTILMSLFAMITLFSSTMIAPALPAISDEFHVNSSIQSQVLLSAFVLSFAFGPLFLGPLSEVYGRVWILQLSNLWYFVWNTLGGFASSPGEVAATRFLAGLGASGSYGIGAGILSDTWRPEERGKSLGIYSVLPLLGPSLGPILGGYVVEHSTWRWIFWSTSIFDACLQIIALFVLSETHGPTLLHRKAKLQRKETGNKNLQTAFERSGPKASDVLKRSLIRPFVFLFTHPIIQLLGIYMAYSFGLLYLVISTFSSLWTDRYHESAAVSGWHFVALAIGEGSGAQLGALMTDRIWRHLASRRSNSVIPEYRVPLMLPSAVMVAAGLICYGWSAEARTHWIVPDIGIVIFAMGTQLSTSCLQAYIIDAYGQYAASATAAASVLRSLTAFAFPMFAPQMYTVLGYGWGNQMLAFIALTFGLPTPLVLWKYGASLRARSKSHLECI